MRNGLLVGSVAQVLVVAAALIGCGDSGSGGSGGSGAAGASGGGGGTPGDCIEITSVAGFTALADSYWSGTAQPGFGGAADDDIDLLGTDPLASSTFSLPASQADCGDTTVCLVSYEDYDPEAEGAIFVANAGSLEVTSSNLPYYFSGSLSDVTLVEVALDDAGGVTAVPNGRCLHIASATLEVTPPVAGWTCAPGYYDELGNGVGADVAYCDCECGAYDPDCDDATLPTPCEAGQTCGMTSGECEGTPTAWTCAPTDYDAGMANGCQCNCGAYDPDCDLGGTVTGCQGAEACNGNGLCVPTTWTCDPDYYGDAFGCDCECGVQDVDCADPKQVVIGCEDGMVCVNGACQ